MTAGWRYVITICACISTGRCGQYFATFTHCLCQAPGTPQTHGDLNSYKSMPIDIIRGKHHELSQSHPARRDNHR
jgi:hypothetical protein